MSEAAKKGWYSFENATIGFVNRETIGGYKDSSILNYGLGDIEKAGYTIVTNIIDGGASKIFANTTFKDKNLLDPLAYSDTYMPCYTNILGFGQTAICVIAQKYGKIGDVVKIKYTYEGINKAIIENTIVAIVGENIENLTTTDSRAGIGDVNGKKCVVGIVIHTNSSEFSWLNESRETLFGENDKYKTCNIVEIEQCGSISGVDDSDEQTENTSGGSSTSFLLKPSDDERKYGINIYEAVQQLIRFSTSAGVTGSGGGDAITALKKYSEFLYYLLNSQVLTGNYVLSSMPWLRPGFNVWVDPLYSDTVYYLQEVQHQGDPIGGATTSVSLIFGRPRSAYVNDSNLFGSMKGENDNVFVNTINNDQKISGSNGDGPWGKYIASDEDFRNIKTATEEYYSHKIEGTTNANESNYHKELYVNGRKSAPVSQKVDSSKIFNGEYTAAEIQAKLDSIYANAPQVVKERVSKLEGVVSAAREYIELHYDKEKKV